MKLIDFSLARRTKMNKFQFWAGKYRPVRSPSYMAPEQIRGITVDARSDIYSLGCTLFELIEGHVPYTGTSQNELLNKHLSAKIPRLSSRTQCVTPPLADLVAAMMDKRPENRPQSMHSILGNVRDNFRVAESAEMLSAGTSTFMGSAWPTESSSSHVAVQQALGPTADGKRAAGRAKRVKTSAMKNWAGRIGPIFRRRSVRVTCGLVISALLAWQVLKPESVQPYLEKLERYQQISVSIAQPPESDSPDDKEAYWRQLGRDALETSTEALQGKSNSRSSSPAEAELRYAAELLPAAVVEAQSVGYGASQRSLTYHLGNAKRYLDERAKDPFGLYHFLDSNLFFWGFLVLNTIGAAWVVKLLITRRK